MNYGQTKRTPAQSPTSRSARLRLSTREELLRSCSAIPDVARNAVDPKSIFVEELGGTFAHYYQTNITTILEAKHGSPKSATSSPSEKRPAFSCGLCKKHFNSDSTLKTHLQSSKHLREQQISRGTLRTAEDPKLFTGSTSCNTKIVVLC